jgi:hypothetical protein
MRLSRQLSDKDFVRKQIAEIDKRDEKIERLENLVAQLKSSRDMEVQATIASFFGGDPDKAVQSTVEMKEELHRLKREKEEMEIIITEQNEKLELYEAQKNGVGGVALAESLSGATPEALDAVFEQSQRFKEMSLMISQQRQTIEDRDALSKVLKTQIAELRSTVRTLELNEFEHLEQLAAAGLKSNRDSLLSLNSKRGSTSSEISLTGSEKLSSRLREAESALEREKKLRQDELNKSAERIASLEAELAISKGKYHHLFLDLTSYTDDNFI